MVVLDPNLDETAIEAMNSRIQSLVTQRGGTVEQVDTWGRKRLAYPIGRFRDGFYILSRLQLPPPANSRHMVAKVTLVGNLGVDPEVRYSADGKPVVSFRLASNYRKRDA